MAETLTQVRARRLEANAKLLDLAGEDDLTDDQEAEFSRLSGDLAKLTKREQAMVAAGADDPPEVVAEGTADDGAADAAFAKLVAGAAITDVMDVALFAKRPAGATAELQQELGLSENAVPLALFAASTVTSGGDAETQEETIAQVFPSAITAGMGVDRRAVDVGVSNVPVVTAPTDGPTATTAIGTGVAHSAVTIAGVQLTPSRLQVSATIGRDELATFRGLEDQVEAVLRAALMSALDYQALYATGGNGLLNFGAAPTDATDVMTFAALLEAVTDTVDGRFAAGLEDLVTLLGPATYTLGARVYRGDADNESAVEKLMRITGGVMTTDLVAAADSDNQQAVTCRGGAMHTGYVQRLWGGVEVIRDPYTKAADGQFVFTLVPMQASKLARAGLYQRHSLHLA